MDFAKIEEKHEKYLSILNEIDIDIRENHERAFEIEFVHNSTAIEGNTLTLVETKLLLDDGISVGGKPLRETYEVVNHQKAFDYVKKCIKLGSPLTEKIVKDIHFILNDNIFVGGVYRNEPVRIVGAGHKPPTGEKMLREIKAFFEDIPFKKKEFHPIEFAAWVHAEFVRIHPFVDGNGRTSRLIMNYVLMEAGYPPVSILVENKLNYYNCLESYAVLGKLEPFCAMVKDLVEERMEEYFW